MNKTSYGLILAVCSGMGLTGCGGGGHTEVRYERHDVHVYERPVSHHHCAYGCRDHYYDGVKLIYVKGHRHGPGCGHVWNGRYWVMADVVPYAHHDCSHHGCHDHYHDGTRLVLIKGHRHGPGCGHVWGGRYWRIAIGTRPVSDHVCVHRGCHDHFYNGERYVYVRGHRHGPNCGHEWSGRYWVPARFVSDRGPDRRGPVRHDHDRDRGRYDRDRDDHRRGIGHTSHVCSRSCHDHFFDGAKLVYLKGHHHSPNCGHYWNGKHWVLGSRKGRSDVRHGPVHRDDANRPVRLGDQDRGQRVGNSRGRAPSRAASDQHLCSRGCDDHYFNGSRLIYIKGHQHGPTCGHRWDGRHWVMAR